MAQIKVVASPETDIWRKPPSTNRFNAPSTSLLPHGKPIPLSQFQSVRATFRADWTTRYDQGGILLHFTHSDSGVQDRWIKAGIEFYIGAPYMASVACLTYADWALSPAPQAAEHTIEMRREGDELGTSLWLYQLILEPDGKTVKERLPLREVTWTFAEEQGWAIQVAAMAARPAKAEDVKGSGKDLVVTFKNTDVETR